MEIVGEVLARSKLPVVGKLTYLGLLLLRLGVSFSLLGSFLLLRLTATTAAGAQPENDEGNQQSKLKGARECSPTHLLRGPLSAVARKTTD